MAESPLLQIEDLRAYLFTRGSVVRAVDGVSFSVNEGETLGLVGESGCGKSMTCLAIMRTLPAPSGRIVAGRIRFQGVDLVGVSEAEMRTYRGRRISMILQDPNTSLNPVLTVGEQVAEPMRWHQQVQGKDLKRRVVEALRRVKIPAPEMRVGDYPHQMSGGMRQRVVGAAALACEPHLLLADEPTTALDATVQAQYLALLKDIQEQAHLAIIFVTHDFGIVAHMCDRVAVMYAGKIVETAPVKALFHHPSHPYTVALLNSVPKLRERVDRLYSIEGEPPPVDQVIPGCSFAPRCPSPEERCSREPPPTMDLGDSHHANCWKLA
ncbi:MAG: ABC transporter ATP-binding protein [Chloroflexi bacterium]|nr:ABC transporter ATP-binding protein [Chloroflexota bacterium]